MKPNNRRWYLPISPLGMSIFCGLMLALLAFSSSAAVQTAVRAAPVIPVYMPIVTKSITSPIPNPTPGVLGDYIVLGWNDLGMHCYNRDFADLAVLPPYNNLVVQVVKRGPQPKIVTSGVKVMYSFPDNTRSDNKSNFWLYAQELFKLPNPLPANIGLTGKGLAGQMDLSGDHYIAEGIPLTEFSDSAPTKPDPYQLAQIVVTDLSGKELARNTVVAPVSTEMRCDNCHSDNGRANSNIHTGKVETNILTLHDQKNSDKYPAGHTGALMSRKPVLCAECHSSNALGAAGVSGLPSLSNAMHKKHKGVFNDPNSIDACYSCHPGPATKCLRDVMSSQNGMTCVSCHGSLDQVSRNPNPWLNEPKCTDCHKEAKYAMDQPLYRNSKGHGGIYCEACHDSTHAIAPSTQSQDAIKFINLQGSAGPLHKCTVCHTNQPDGSSPHR